VPLSDLPGKVGKDSTVYEITLAGRAPDPLFLNLAEDLGRFAAEYASALRAIRTNHPGLQVLHVFPAVPAPVAVSLGREVLPKVDPILRIFDYDKREGGFAFALEVNTL